MSLSATSTSWRSPHNLLRISIVVALITIVFKALAWHLTGSVGLLSDALESFVNLAGAMFALAMVTIAKRPPDDEHPYGHTKAEYFSAGFEGLLIIGASAAIIWTSVHRWINPQPLENLDWGLALALVSTGFNGALAWVMFRSARIYRSHALDGDAKHLVTDVYTSIGVVAGLGLAHLTGWLWLDAAVGVMVGLNILWQGGVLVWTASQGLLDSSIDPKQLQKIQTVLTHQMSAAQAETGAMIGFDSLFTRQAGEISFMDVHMHVPSEWTIGLAAQWRARTEAALLEAIPHVHARIELLPRGIDTEHEKSR